MSDKTPSDLPSDVQETLMEFPCDFPLKVFLKPEKDIDQKVLTLLEPHIGKLPLSAVKRKISSTGKFVSLTVHYVAVSKQQVDAVFKELSDCPFVVMAM